MLNQPRTTASAAAGVLGAALAELILLGCSTTPPASRAQPDDITPVNPDDYLSPWLPPGAQSDWTFYTDSNINCVVTKTVVCITDPSTGMPGDPHNNIVTFGKAGAWLTSSSTQARIFGPPTSPFDASKRGKLLERGHSITANDVQCAVSATSVISCKSGDHRFVIDPATARTF